MFKGQIPFISPIDHGQSVLSFLDLNGTSLVVGLDVGVSSQIWFRYFGCKHFSPIWICSRFGYPFGVCFFSENFLSHLN